MPEMFFTVRWPDGAQERCYSPSLVITDHLAVGADYALGDFVARCDAALSEASERVQQKYGYFCSSAIDQLGQIKHRAQAFEADAAPRVQVLAFTPGSR